jgi:hypothetical protein
VKNPFEQYPVIEFKDIQKGDTIARVVEENTVLDIKIGAVEVKDDHGGTVSYWYTEGGMRAIANSYQSNKTFYLIDRPKPELPTEKGSGIFVKKYGGTVLETPALVIHDGSEGVHHWFVPGGIDIPGLEAWWIMEDLIEDFTLAEIKEVSA